MLSKRTNTNGHTGEITAERFEQIALSRLSHHIRLEYLSERALEQAERDGHVVHTREYRGSNTEQENSEG